LVGNFTVWVNTRVKQVVSWRYGTGGKLRAPTHAQLSELPRPRLRCSKIQTHTVH